MDRNLIFECNDYEIATTDFGNRSPKTESVMFLWLRMNSVLNFPCEKSLSTIS